MFPSYEQIRQEAFFRWQRRGSVHGHHDEDWLAAEQDLLLALNYEVAAFHALQAGETQFIGEPGRRVCRFCEQAAPATSFGAPMPVLPGLADDPSLLTYEECDECHALLSGSVEATLGRFLDKARAGGSGPSGGPRMSIEAFKGLVRVALAIMPADEIDSFEDTIEWVANPDHDFDVSLFAEPGCDVRIVPSPQALPVRGPWVALLRRVDDEAPMPYMLVYVATPEVVVQGPVPLSARDHDLDGERTMIPRACPRLDQRPQPARTYAARLHSASNGFGHGAATRM